MCDRCNYEEYLEKMEELIEEYKLPQSTKRYVEDVFEWVEEHKHITPAQIKKINHIELKYIM